MRWIAIFLAGLAVLTLSGPAQAKFLADSKYFSLYSAFVPLDTQTLFIATHLPNFVAICGLPPSVSAQAIALIGVCNAIGTLVAGYLCQRWGNSTVLALIYFLRTAAIALFFILPVSVETTLVFAAAMGFLWLSVVPPVSGLINSLFGSANFGALFGVMFLSHQVGAFLGAFLGAWLGGLSYEWSGSYSGAWSSLIIVGVLAGIFATSCWRQASHPPPRQLNAVWSFRTPLSTSATGS